MTSRSTKTSKTASAQSAVLQPSTPFIVASWLAVVAVAALIFYMSAHTGDELDSSSGIITLIREWLKQAAFALFGSSVDISPLGHFAEYFLFGAVLTNALRLHMPLRKAALIALLIASTYGVTDEIHQIFVPQRSADPLDWVVDTIAAGLACLLTAVLLMRRNRANHTQSKRGNNL